MGKVKDILSKSSEAEVITEVSIPYGKGKDNLEELKMASTKTYQSPMGKVKNNILCLQCTPKI